jgi:magnesium-transporting ATPase (P-type)
VVWITWWISRPPRDPGQPILTSVLLERIVLVSLRMLAGAYGVFIWELERTESIVAAHTAAVNVFVMVELFYLFNCRSPEHTMFHVGLFSNPLDDPRWNRCADHQRFDTS